VVGNKREGKKYKTVDDERERMRRNIDEKQNSPCFPSSYFFFMQLNNIAILLQRKRERGGGNKIVRIRHSFSFML